MNAADKTPLEGASVFINNASGGTITDKNGRFELTGIAYNNFELVISFVTFETIVVKISPSNIHNRFRIELVKKDNKLEEIIIGPRIKDGWEVYGKFFTELFIGTSANATECKLMNPEVLQFRMNKKSNSLEVSATDQLRIENNALGYTINYQLEGLTYDYNLRTLTYLGYSSFEKMSSGRARMLEQWKRNRKEAYMGSIMHFMRCIYKNTVTEEGFTMREMVRLYKKDSSTSVLYNEAISGKYQYIDTAMYMVQLMKPSSGFDRNPIAILFNKNLLNPDSVRFKVDDKLYLSFANNIRVIYLNEFEKPEYVIQQNPSREKIHRGSRRQTSILIMAAEHPVLVESNGLFYDPLDIYTEEYWAWEKMAETLPADYIIGE